MTPLAAQMTADHEAARAGFIHDAQFDRIGGEFFDELVHGIERAVDDAVTADVVGMLGRDGHGDRFFMDVQTEVMHCFIHGCLVLFQYG